MLRNSDFLSYTCCIGVSFLFRIGQTCIIRLIFLGSFICFTGSSYASDLPKVDLALISQIESSNRPYVIADGGRAYGLYQIHPELVLDFNKATGKGFSHRDMLDPSKAEIVASWAFNTYFVRILKYLKKPVTVSNLLTCFNAGCGAVKTGNLPKQYLKKYQKLGGKL